jgi:hypothetical protein
MKRKQRAISLALMAGLIFYQTALAPQLSNLNTGRSRAFCSLKLLLPLLSNSFQ